MSQHETDSTEVDELPDGKTAILPFPGQQLTFDDAIAAQEAEEVAELTAVIADLADLGFFDEEDGPSGPNRLSPFGI